MTRERQLQIWIGGILVFGLLVYVLRGVLAPFVAGMAVAYFIDPIADKLEEWGLSRLAATVVLTIAFFAISIGLLLLILPVLQSQIFGFAERVPIYAVNLRDWLGPLISQAMSHLSEDEIRQLIARIAGFAGDAANIFGDLIKRLLSGGAAIVEIISLLVLTPLVTFYLLRDWDVMVAKVDSWLPRSAAPVIRERFLEIDDTLAGFVRGQATVCLVLGTFYAVGLSLVGLEFGLLVGLAAGIISFIPYFGTIVGLAVGLGIALAQFSDWTNIAMVAGVFAIGQVIEGNFLTPKLVGERVGLHPVWVIFALMAGGTLFGFTGVMIAVPVAAVIGVLVRYGLSEYLDSRLYLGSKTVYQEAPESEASSSHDNER